MGSGRPRLSSALTVLGPFIQAQFLVTEDVPQVADASSSAAMVLLKAKDIQGYVAGIARELNSCQLARRKFHTFLWMADSC